MSDKKAVPQGLLDFLSPPAKPKWSGDTQTTLEQNYTDWRRTGGEYRDKWFDNEPFNDSEASRQRRLDDLQKAQEMLEDPASMPWDLDWARMYIEQARSRTGG